MISIDKYWQLIEKIEHFSEGWKESPPFHLSCRPGCDDCCQSRFTLFAVELAAIGETLKKASNPLLEEEIGDRDNGCPFLQDGRCLIYPYRPIICRTQGYPHIFLDEEGRTVSHICDLNRSGQEISLPAKYVMNLDTLNQCLSSLNYLYLAEMEEKDLIIPFRSDILDILDFSTVGRGA